MAYYIKSELKEPSSRTSRNILIIEESYSSVSARELHRVRLNPVGTHAIPFRAACDAPHHVIY